MKLPDKYMYETMHTEIVSDDERRFQTLHGFAEWVMKNKPTEIEMTEEQFWNFTYLQPLPYEERYWTTFHGIPLRVPEMSEEQQKRLRIHATIM